MTRHEAIKFLITIYCDAYDSWVERCLTHEDRQEKFKSFVAAFQALGITSEDIE